MSRKQRLVYLLLCLVVLLTIGRFSTYSFAFVLEDAWFSAGLFLLILLSAIDQPHFASDTGVFLNGITGWLSLLATEPRFRNVIWYSFFIWAAVLVVSGYFLMLRRKAPIRDEPRYIQLLSKVTRVIGRPQALFSAFFLWGISTRFSVDSLSYAALMWFWALFMIVDIPAVSRAIGDWLNNLSVRRIPSVGRLTAFVSPRVAEAELTADAPPDSLGRQVAIVAYSGEVCALGLVVDDRILAGKRRIRVGITKVTPSWPHLATGEDATIRFETDVARNSTIVSTVDVGTDLSTLKVVVSPEINLTDGELLWTTSTQGFPLYYQVVEARVTHSPTEHAHGIHELTVSAGQLGVWNQSECHFTANDWVPPPGGMVFRTESGGVAPTIPTGRIKVGSIPHSQFPIHLAVEDVVTHNTAILGVTGSGKSYLCLHILRGLLQNKIKVLVLDITRQYFPMLLDHSPRPITDIKGLTNWLDSENLLGIYQFADSGNYPHTTSELVESCLTNLQKKVKLRAGTNEPARLCVVLEEAHSLIPEWNQVAQKADSDSVNRTSRVVLQGRKYGLGCVIVTQRTANITKTILNQCNTIAALQCFDQTAIDFLGNYMGAAHAASISRLPFRHAVIVGKGSSSTTPVRISIDDVSIPVEQPKEGTPTTEPQETDNPGAGKDTKQG